MVLCDRLEAQQKERETRHAALTRAAIARFDEVPTPVNLNFLFHNSYSITPTDLRKTILNLAVQGKLVSERHGTVDPRSTFESLMTIKRRAIEETSLPRSWVLASYRNLTSLVTSGSRGWKEFYSDSGSIFVRTQNIKTDRLLLDDIAYVNLPDSVEGLRAQIKKNDILITITGANVTKTARVEDDIPKAYVSQHIALTRPRWPDMSAWLHLCFIAPGAARGKLEALAYGDKPGLNLNNIRDLVIPIPPLSQQRQIIAEVDRLMKMVDRMEILLSESKIQTKHLLDAVVYELLHPIADVIEFPSSETDCASQRAAIGCYAIEHLVRNPSFGRVMLMKACYLSETHLGLPLGWQPMRQAAGPWDPWIEDFESMGKGNDWFTVTEKILYNSHSKIEYSAKKGLKAKAVEAITVLGDQKAEFDRLLNLFVDKNTEEAEIIATLFAAWNDFLIDGKTPTDDEIIREVRENWHPSKERFTPARLNRWIGWMRSHHLTPKGHGPRTRQQLTLALS
jgi:type I restriction enzyme S subunit